MIHVSSNASETIMGYAMGKGTVILNPGVSFSSKGKRKMIIILYTLMDTYLVVAFINDSVQKAFDLGVIFSA